MAVNNGRLTDQVKTFDPRTFGFANTVVCPRRRMVGCGEARKMPASPRSHVTALLRRPT